MILRPPISTRPDTLFPYSSLFRSALIVGVAVTSVAIARPEGIADEIVARQNIGAEVAVVGNARVDHGHDRTRTIGQVRSEERRVGKECVSTCRSRWSPYH